MNDKINVNGVIYDQLGNLKVNNREYVFGIYNNDLEFFEKVTSDEGIKYNLTNKDLTLAGNAGTSLTRLNERIVMTHIADDLKSDIRNGKIKNLDDIGKSISDIQEVVDTDPNIKKLLKGNVTDLDEAKFAQRSNNLVSYFDSKKKDKARKDDDFDIVEGGIDKTFINDEMFEQLNRQEDPFANTIITPTLARPVVHEEVQEELKPVEEVNVVKPEETPVQPLATEVKPSSSFMGIEEEKLDNGVIDAILREKKEQIKPEDVAYLENLKASREVQEPKEEVLEEKGKLMVLTKPTKPSKKAAYVDTVILCLITQLSIFGLLIFVLLLIK